MSNKTTPDGTDHTDDPGHLLPDAAWEKIKAEAEQYDADTAEGAQEPAKDEA